MGNCSSKATQTQTRRVDSDSRVHLVELTALIRAATQRSAHPLASAAAIDSLASEEVIGVEKVGLEKNLPPILFIPMDKLLTLDEVPRLGISPAQRASLGYGDKENITDPKVKESLVQDWKNLFLCADDKHFPATDLLVELGDINMETSVVGFVSHCWLRGWVGAPGYQDWPHPDDANHSKHWLTKEALELLRRHQFRGCTDCYIWIDYTCINQDANPAAELKQLDLIIKSCDFLLTPAFDIREGWSAVENSRVSYSINSKAWQQYLTRSWCLVEMMYAANVPSKDNAASSKSRLAMMNGPAMMRGLDRGYRPHFLYGVRENRVHDGNPIPLPPLKDSFFNEYNPITRGQVSDDADKAKIAELVHLLQPLIDANAAKVGYVGDRDAKGAKHCIGKYTFETGDVYEGEFKNDAMNGQGTYTYANGDVYEGGFKNDVRSGYGKKEYANGNLYEGYFLDDVKNGWGKFTYADGRVDVGEWRNGHKLCLGEEDENPPVSRSETVISRREAEVLGQIWSYWPVLVCSSTIVCLCTCVCLYTLNMHIM